MRNIFRSLLAAFALALLVSFPAPANIIPSNIQAATASGTLSSTGTVALGVQGVGTVNVEASGSGTGLTYSFQCNSGSVQQTLQATPMVSGVPGAPVTSASTQTGLWTINTAGCQDFRVNLTAISGGSQTFKLTGVSAVSQPINPNSATNFVYVGSVVGGSVVSSNNPVPAIAPAYGTLGTVADVNRALQVKASAGVVTHLNFNVAASAAAGTFVFLFDTGSLPGDGAVNLNDPNIRGCWRPDANGNLDISFNPPLQFNNVITVLVADAATASCRNIATNATHITGQVFVQGK